MLISELYKLMVNKIAYAVFMWGDRPLWIHLCLNHGHVADTDL